MHREPSIVIDHSTLSLWLEEHKFLNVLVEGNVKTSFRTLSCSRVGAATRVHKSIKFSICICTIRVIGLSLLVLLTACLSYNSDVPRNWSSALAESIAELIFNQWALKKLHTGRAPDIKVRRAQERRQREEQSAHPNPTQ